MFKFGSFYNQGIFVQPGFSSNVAITRARVLSAMGKGQLINSMFTPILSADKGATRDGAKPLPKPSQSYEKK